jgi:hypothetical protein
MDANHSQEQWRWVTYFDSESDLSESADRIKHIPKLICATYVDRQRGTRVDRDFEGERLCEAFYSDLSDRVYSGTTMRVLGHNVGYDLAATGGIQHLVNLGWRVDSLYEKGLTYILRLRGRDKRGLVFLSSTQYWNVKLQKLGDLFGLEKFVDIGHTEKDFEKLRVYCRRDVEIVVRAMEWLQEFVQENNLGGMAATLPSLASKAFRHRFMPYAPVIHNYEPVLVLERAAYHGGRTDPWFIGQLPKDQTYHKVDVNSMYPDRMYRCRHPYKLVKLYPNGNTWATLQSFMKKYFVVADVTVDTPLPCVPRKDASLGKLTFPIGRFKTVLTSHELRLLTEAEIVQVRAIACYEDGDIFSSFVHFFYTERQKAKEKGETAKAELLKLLMNSLYGKFGQKSSEWVRVGDADPAITRCEDILLPDGSEYKLRTFGGATWMNDGAVMESFDSFPAIAASVTSAARALLWKYITIAGIENVFYMDTDSLFVNDAGLSRLSAAGSMNEVELGSLKLEKSSNDVEIYGSKDYRFGAETKHKGIPADAKRVNVGGEEKALVWVWPKSATWLREGNLSGFENRAVLKNLVTKFNKGTITASGRVAPLELHED